MEKDGTIKKQLIQKEDIFLEHLNYNTNPLKNEEFIKGSLETFDKFFNEEESVKTNLKPINLSIDYSPISYKNNFNKSKGKSINGKDIMPLNLNATDFLNEKSIDITNTKKQLFNTDQIYESVEDLKKRKLILNRESAKKSRLKKKKYIENLEKEFLLMKEEMIRLKSLQNSNQNNNLEIINDSFPKNNIIKNVIKNGKVVPNIDLNLNLNINNLKDKEIMSLKKDELNIISNNLENDTKTMNNYINKQKKLLQNILIKQIDIITPAKVKNFQNKFLKLEEIKKDDSIPVIKNKITKNLEIIVELYDINILDNDEKNQNKNNTKGINIYNFYNALKAYIELYEIMFKKIDNLLEPEKK